jgi:hypothetical protein
MNELDWAYLAGFIDGEGTITIASDGRKFHPCVSVANTDYAVLEWCITFVGNGGVSSKKKYKDYHKQSYYISWRYDAALNIMSKCLPYLKVKRKQAELILSKWKMYTPRNGKYTEDILIKKSELIKQIRLLNKRCFREI